MGLGGDFIYGAAMQHTGLNVSSYSGAKSLTGKRPSSKHPTVITHGPHGKKQRVTVDMRGSRRTIADSNVMGPEPVFDDGLLANMGTQRLTALHLNGGPSVNPKDGISRFLKNLQQNGKVISEFCGTCQSTKDFDQRIPFAHIFRHRLSKSTMPAGQATGLPLPQLPYEPPSNGGNWTQSAYPTDVTILMPTGVVTNDLPQTGNIISHSFYNQLKGNQYWIPINRPDLEDMSWNLNKLKLTAPTAELPVTPAVAPANAGITPIQSFDSGFALQVPLFEKDRHRRQSQISINNYKNVNSDNLSDLTDVTNDNILSPYNYDAVLRHGSIDYDFMNKDVTGCTIEVILYKFKKNHNFSADHTAYNQKASPLVDYPLNLLQESIGQGYIKTVGDDWSTENLEGRAPVLTDVWDNPNYPLLPVLSKTRASENPCTEIMRNKFIMTSGSRRKLSIKLPGHVYDPCSIKMTTYGDVVASSEQVEANGILVEQTSNPDLGYETEALAQIANGSRSVIPLSENIPILDEFSYMTVLAVNGQKMTRFFDKPPRGAVPVPPDDGVLLSTFGNFAGINEDAPVFDSSPIPVQIGYPWVLTNRPVGYYDVQVFPKPGLPEELGQAAVGSSASVYVGTPVYTGAETTYNHGIIGRGNQWGPTAFSNCKPATIRLTIRPLAADGFPVAPPTAFDPTSTATTTTYSNYVSLWSVVDGGSGFFIDQMLTNSGSIPSDIPEVDPITPGGSIYNTHDFAWPYSYSGNLPSNIQIASFMDSQYAWYDTTNNPNPNGARVRSLTTDPVPTPATAGTELPMGDCHGAFHVDFTCKYVEHLGACLYQAPKKRHLYDRGRAPIPSLSQGGSEAIPASKTSARIIIPATSAVRTAAQITAQLDSSGNPTESVGVTSGNYTVNGRAQGIDN